MGDVITDFATSDQIVGQLVAACAVIIAAVLPPAMRRFHRRTKVREMLEIYEKIPDDMQPIRRRYADRLELEVELLLDKELEEQPKTAGRFAQTFSGVWSARPARSARSAWSRIFAPTTRAHPGAFRLPVRRVGPIAVGVCAALLTVVFFDDLRPGSEAGTFPDVDDSLPEGVLPIVVVTAIVGTTVSVIGDQIARRRKREELRIARQCRDAGDAEHPDTPDTARNDVTE